MDDERLERPVPGGADSGRGGDADGAAQARHLLRAVRRAEVDVREVWFRCFTLGGELGELEVDAYLHGCLRLPPAERGLLTRAVAELTG